MLSNRIKIKPLRNSTTRIPKEHMFFYTGYASFVGKALRKPIFQRFLRWLLKRENIDKHLIKDIKIRILPYQKDNGKSLAGRRKRNGSISIFPKSLQFYRGLKAEHGSEIARTYVKSRAWATLIHEILHAKYSSDEERVRRLTERYFSIYVGNPKTGDFDSVILEILFNSGTSNYA
jgi:hypothetical protein